MKNVSRGLVEHKIGNDLLVHIDPISVSGYAGYHSDSPRYHWPLKGIVPKFPPGSRARRKMRGSLRRRHPFLWPDRYFHSLTSFDETVWAWRIRGLIQSLPDFHRSSWFLELLEEQRRRGDVELKGVVLASIGQLNSFFEERMVPLVQSMADAGYDYTLEADYAKAVVDPSGNLVKSANGRHRFAAARELGVTRFPLQIVGVSKSWVSKQLGSGLSSEVVLEALPELINKVQEVHSAGVNDHPSQGVGGESAPC